MLAHLLVRPAVFPQTELAMRGSNGIGKGPRKVTAIVAHFDQENKHYLVTLAFVSSRQKGGSRAQTSIYTLENHNFFVQMAPQASWPRDVPAETLEARSLQPGVLSQAPSVLQPGVLGQVRSLLSQESSARSLQPRVISQESSAKMP